MTATEDSGTLREQIARTLAEKFTSPYGQRNPNWDIDRPDDDTNPYHLTVPMAERIAKGSMMTTFTAGDGYLSMAPASIPETVDAVLPVVAPLVERLRQAELERTTHRLALDEVAGHAERLRADLAEAREELAENTGVLKAIRRQRDEAREAYDSERAERLDADDERQRVQSKLDGVTRAMRTDLNYVRWLHAEAVWQRDQLKIEADHQGDRGGAGEGT